MEEVKYVDLGLQYASLREQILSKFDEISKRGHYIGGEELISFEKNFADYCGTNYAIGVANGTDALFLSLYALGVGEGDEVITAPNSFVATAGAIAATGAKPVFVDVRDDYNINPDLIESRITRKTKAIIPVHLTGRVADMDPIIEIADSNKLYIIEDAAQAVGATYKDLKAGLFGDTGCFSLHPLKNLHVHGDGGVITTNSKYFYDKLTSLRNHGLRDRDTCSRWGFNSRLDNIQAAIADIKLQHLDVWNARHREIADMYREGLKEFVKVPTEEEHEKPVYHIFVIETDERKDLVDHLSSRGIETKIHYPTPIHMQPAAASLTKWNFPITEGQSEKILTLPIYPELTDSKVESVIEGVRSFYELR